MHSFIDGSARLVTGIQANNNNRAQTVLDLFTNIIEVWGLLSRVRGDHDIENLLVAAFMEAARGIERGSYIWGRLVLIGVRLMINISLVDRSVHNICIERLWCDFTQGFGAKWKIFFQDF
jgi:hypothetical protein